MPIIKEVKWGEDNPIENAPQLTEEEQFAIKKRMEALDKILAQDQKAKYKLEVMFGHERRAMAPTPGILSFWGSGAKLNGGGDTKLYICGGKQSKQSDCEAFIPDASMGYGYLVCPNCKKVWKGDDVIGEILARLTMQGWAQLIHKYFLLLEMNADIYVKHPKEDLRSSAIREQEKAKGGELLGKSRANRAVYIYPLKNIIKDTANGADLLNQFYKLLKA